MALTSRGELLAGRYRVLDRLGSGGMAVVLLAEDERLGRRVAIKRLRAESPDDAATRLQREAKLGASLNHPNLVAVYDVATEEDGVLIVMEYVDGETLRDEIDRGPLPPARALEVLAGMAAGLDHAHAQGVVHRDVKPANVLIAARDGAVKITDLGIATAAEQTKITRSGVVLGTASYMAPERLDGHAGGPAVDVYAAAAVAFEMLSGRQAVSGRTPVEIARRVVEAPPPDLAEVVPRTPRRAADALARGMAKDPSERPATVGELARELSAAYAQEAAPERPARRRRIAPALVALLAAALAVVVVLALQPGSHETPRAPAAKRHKPPRAHASTPGTASTPSTPGTAGTASTPSTASTPAPSGPSPAATLTSFYMRAANGDFAGAWSLGTDRLHGQFAGSIGKFTRTLATLRSIQFPRLQLTSQTASSATVAFSSVAHHTNRTDHCSGEATLVRVGSGWLVDHLSVSC